MIKGTAITATVSGTISKITGGKFANGAVTGAFIHLFNSMADPRLNGKGVPDSMGGDSSKDFIDARKLVANKLDEVAKVGSEIEMIGTVTKRPFLMLIGGMISVGATTLKILVSPKQYEAYEIYNEYAKPQYTVTPAY